MFDIITISVVDCQLIFSMATNLVNNRVPRELANKRVPQELWLIILEAVGEDWEHMAMGVCRKWFVAIKTIWRDRERKSTGMVTGKGPKIPLHISVYSPAMIEWSMDPKLGGLDIYDHLTAAIRYGSHDQVVEIYKDPHNTKYELENHNYMVGNPLMYTAARYRKIRTLAWMLDTLGILPGDDPVSGPMLGAFEDGHIKTIRVLMQRGCRFHGTLYIPAIENNNVGLMIRFLSNSNVDITYAAWERAATIGNLVIFTYLCETFGSPITAHVSTLVQCGHVHILEYLSAYYDRNHMSNSPLDNQTANACRHNQLETLRWLVREFDKLNDNCLMHAVEHGSVEMCEFVLDEGGEWSDFEYSIAIRRKDINILQWLFDNTEQLEDHLLKEAIKTGHTPTIEWMIERRFPFDPETMIVACREKCIIALRYMLETMSPTEECDEYVLSDECAQEVRDLFKNID